MQLLYISDDKFREECGVFGIYGHHEAANMTSLGLYALQHRGQESAGIVSSDGNQLHIEKAMGWVSDVFTKERLKRLPGYIAIGHVRYSTAGASHIKNAQPLLANTTKGAIAIAHNGNLINTEKIREELESTGSIFQSTVDSEVILHILVRSKGNTLPEMLVDALQDLKGSYSLVMMTNRELIAARDPKGFRPLSLGKLKDGYIVASETCAFDLLEASYVREIEPGEILIIDEHGIKSYKPFPRQKHSLCIFEYIYFSRPDSHVFGRNVYEVRLNLGEELAKEHYIDADLIIPVPDSGVCAALGYSKKSGTPFEIGLIRNHYVGRTFIEPHQHIRHFGVKVKLNPVKSAIEGKKIVVIDDSIVRGTTSRIIVKMLKSAGAKEVHMRISAPPTIAPCFYGIDTPTRKELIASSHKVEEIRKYLGANTLGYLSVGGILKASEASEERNFCTACFTGDYPVPFAEKTGVTQLEFFSITQI